MLNNERTHCGFGCVAVAEVLLLSVGALTPIAHAQCGFDWAQGFQAPGLNGPVTDLAVFDDGSGNGAEVYAVGAFTTASSVSAGGVAKWGGTQWLPVGNELVGAHCIEALPNPSGDGVGLYVGGKIAVDGVASHYVAKWNGSDWEPLGGAMNSTIRALEVFDDGSGAGQQLYAGGSFTTAGGVNAMAVAKWDGAAWAAVQGSTTFTGFVRALEVFDDDGSGPNAPCLYAGGNVTSPNDQTIRNIARWHGDNWTGVGGGVSWSGASSGGIYSLAAHDVDGSGPLSPGLFACGEFWYAGGIEVDNIACWNGANWSALGDGFSPTQTVYTLVSDAKGSIDGSPALYVGGEMTKTGGPAGITVNKIARWDGEAWAPLSTGVLGSNVSALAIEDSKAEEGSKLMVAGAFLAAGGIEAEGIATWDGTDWSAPADFFYPPAYGKVSSLLSFDDGTGEKLFVGFESQPACLAVACYDGSDWSIPGSLSGWTNAFTVFDDGSGEGSALYVGGYFLPAMVAGLRKWNGREWVQFASDVGGQCFDLCVGEEDGKGAVLFAAGKFSFPGPIGLRYILKYDGTTITPISGIGLAGWASLASFDDGSGEGPSLYVASPLLWGDGNYEGIVRWTGSEWVSVGGGIDGGACQEYLEASIFDIEVFDDGSGPALYAAGRFGSAGGVAVCNIAKWDGTTWSDVGGGITSPEQPYVASVYRLAVFNDALYAMGQFSHAGGVPATNIAKWDGKAWSPLGLGIEMPPYFPQIGSAHAWQNSLFVGGDFSHAGGLPSHNFAKWTEVDDEPVIIDQPSDVESNLGQSAMYSVAAWGGELSYQWRKNGIDLLDGDHISGSTTATLHIDSISGDDAGSFDVVVTSNCGTVTSDAAALSVHCQFDIAPIGFADGVVNVDDLLMVINAWGVSGGPADVNGDGIVDHGDLSALIATWGDCP